MLWVGCGERTVWPGGDCLWLLSFSREGPTICVCVYRRGSIPSGVCQGKVSKPPQSIPEFNLPFSASHLSQEASAMSGFLKSISPRLSFTGKKIPAPWMKGGGAGVCEGRAGGPCPPRGPSVLFWVSAHSFSASVQPFTVHL